MGSGIIKAKDVITEAVNRAVRLAAQHNRGDVIPWGSLVAAAGFDRDHTHWPAFDRRFRKTVQRTRGINMLAVPGVGLKLLTPDEDVKVRSEKRRGRASRQLSRDATELQAIKLSDLTPPLIIERTRRVRLSRDARRRVLHAERVERTVAKGGDRGLYGKPV